MRSENGFTLVELLMVMAILAILGVLAAPAVAETVTGSRERICAANVEVLRETINRYHADQIAAGVTAEADLWPGVKQSDPRPIALTDYDTYRVDGLERYLPLPMCPFASGDMRNSYEITYHWGEGEVSRVVGFEVRCTGCYDGRH